MENTRWTKIGKTREEQKKKQNSQKSTTATSMLICWTIAVRATKKSIHSAFSPLRFTLCTYHIVIGAMDRLFAALVLLFFFFFLFFSLSLHFLSFTLQQLFSIRLFIDKYYEFSSIFFSVVVASNTCFSCRKKWRNRNAYGR